MRSVALDLGQKITFCEVSGGTVVRRATVNSFEALERQLGPRTPAARVAIEACREVWHVERRLREWGHEPLVVDTTRVKQLGVGHHNRKTDRIDAEVLARAVEAGSIPLAHVLSPHRQRLRMQLSVRRGLVETRANYVAMVRGLARAHGVQLGGRCEAAEFARKVEDVSLGEELRTLVAPLIEVIRLLDSRIIEADHKLETLCATEPVALRLCTTPGVGLVVAAAFVSVIDDAKRFRHAHQVEAYLGLVPSEHTSVHRRLGSITKQGNSYLRALLVQSAWCILRSKGQDPLTLWARAIVQRRGKRIAVVAVARRLVGVLWAMWRDGTVYDAARLAQAAVRGLEQHAQTLELQRRALQQAARKNRHHHLDVLLAEGSRRMNV
jgi:transposase